MSLKFYIFLKGFLHFPVKMCHEQPITYNQAQQQQRKSEATYKPEAEKTLTNDNNNMKTNKSENGLKENVENGVTQVADNVKKVENKLPN